jgi:hypothetical protein
MQGRLSHVDARMLPLALRKVNSLGVRGKIGGLGESPLPWPEADATDIVTV